MKQLNVNEMGLREMTRSEMIAVEGGTFKELACEVLSAVGDALETAGKKISEFGGWLKGLVCK